MRYRLLCFYTLIICSALSTTPLRAEYSDEHVALFSQAQQYKELFQKKDKELQPFVADLDAIMSALKKQQPTSNRLNLLSQQLTRYEKIVAVINEKPFDRFRYRLLRKMLSRHAALYGQYRQLLRDRQTQRRARPPRGASFQKLDEHQASLAVMTRKISAVRERMGELDRTLMADNRSFITKHKSTIAMSAIAAVTMLWLWINGYLNLNQSSPQEPSTTIDTGVLTSAIATVSNKREAAAVRAQIAQLPTSQQQPFYNKLNAVWEPLSEPSRASLANLSPAAKALVLEIQTASDPDELSRLGGSITKKLTDESDIKTVRSILAMRRKKLGEAAERTEILAAADNAGLPAPSLISGAQYLRARFLRPGDLGYGNEDEKHWENKYGPNWQKNLSVDGVMIATRPADKGKSKTTPAPGDPVPDESKR